MEIQSRSARLYRPQNIAALDGMLVKLWPDSGKARIPFEVQGSRGIWHSKNQDFVVKDDSQLVTPEGLIFEAPNIFFDASEKSLTTNELVQVSRKGTTSQALRLSGRGLLVLIKEHVYHLKAQVQAKQSLPGGGFFRISAHQAYFDPSKSTATFQSKVRMGSKTFNMKGERLELGLSSSGGNSSQDSATFRPSKFLLGYLPTDPKRKGSIQAKIGDLDIMAIGLKADLTPEGEVSRSEALGEVLAKTKDGLQFVAQKLITTSEPDGRQVMELSGSVKIVSTERVAHCEEAKYYPDTGDFIMNTSASLTRGNQVLQGEKIRFSTKHNEVIVERVQGTMDRKDLIGR